MKRIKLPAKLLAISILLIIFNLATTISQNIYKSLDGSKWEQSQYTNESNFNISKYLQSEQTMFQNLTIPGKYYIVPIETLFPYQDIAYFVYEVDANGGLNNIKNLTINELNSESNIFYDKYSIPISSLNNSVNDEKKNLNNFDSSNKNESVEIIAKNKSVDYEFLSAKVQNITAKVECNPSFMGLSLDSATEKITENSLYENVINFFSINFVTYKNTEGVFIEKYLNGTLANKTQLANFIMNNLPADFSKVKIAKMFAATIDSSYYLFLVDEAYANVYLFEIKSSQKILSEFDSQINSLSLKFIFAFEKEQIDKFDFKDLIAASILSDISYVYFVTKNGLFLVNYQGKVNKIISFDSFQDPDTAETIKFDIIGSAFDQEGCYLAIKKYGLISFLTNGQKIRLVFRHPYIERVESFYSKDKNIGLFLNNKEKTKEFLLELNKPNYLYKGNYSVNKVFFADSEKTKADYFSEGVLDPSASRSFIFEKQSNKVYLIARNLPNKINNIDTYFNLPEQLKEQKFSYFNLVSVYENKVKENTFAQGALILQTDDLYQYKFFRFNFSESKINCLIRQNGIYWFKHTFYSYQNNQLTFYAIDKKIELTEPNDNDNQDYTFIVIFIIILSSAVIFGVYYMLKKWRQNRIIDNYTNFAG